MKEINRLPSKSLMNGVIQFLLALKKTKRKVKLILQSSNKIYNVNVSPYRIEVNKLLQLTEKEVILSPNAKCKDDKNYKPDREMTSLITTKIKCNLPWSNLQMDHFEDCKTEEEFENYLKEIIEEQEAIEQIAKKCRYKIWTLTHWGKVSRDGNTGNTSLTIDLLSTRGQVCTYSPYGIYIFSNHIFILIFCRSILKSKFMFTL